MAKKQINPSEDIQDNIPEEKVSKKEKKQERLSNAEIAQLTKDLSEKVEKEYNLRKREGSTVIEGKKVNHMELEPTMLMLRRSYSILYSLTGRQSRIA